ncbi:hypothetical protein QYS49_34690 [Marivirga salinae]|uniref:CorA-like Mg2+ transporter protein n=1 Tax=Marivirga salinarum TaxID=3059078 RepID=A0AA51NCR2_9BACT|nr:hypothetical protein [Marivirga sp. BDSF4-3]WMN12807.1 hypothetical protein QYS49_34690 [Marivirga sp. BDSF4-3]
MPKGKVLFTVKYDLGSEIQTEKFKEALLQHYPSTEALNNDLTIFNFSYLSSKKPSFKLYSTQINGWTKELEIDQLGIITFFLTSPEISTDDKFQLEESLLKTYDYFVTQKNKDYKPYLNDHNNLSGSLEYLKKEVHEENPIELVNFSKDVSLIRDIFKNEISHDILYVFHDFRTIFCVDDIKKNEEIIPSFLNLERSNKRAIDLNQYNLIDFKGYYIFANTWSYVIDESVLNNEKIFFSLFSIAHSNWFLSQCWVYRLKEIINQDNLYQKYTNQDIHNLKSKILSDLFTMKNADLVVKSSAFNSLLERLLANFKINSQYELIDLQVQNLENYIDRLNENFERSSQKQNQRNANILEFLFAINAIAGIAAFAPTIFTTDISDNFEINLPRMISISLLVVSTLIYLIFIARRLRRRKDEY